MDSKSIRKGIESVKPMLFSAIVAMVLALVLYSVGVWGEKLVGRLKTWQLYFFWTGLLFDAGGTILMTRIANSGTFSTHGLTGAIALFLMAIHATWATLALVLKQERIIQNFHRFSILVWTIWLIPFISGAILARP
jgi:uncharacterized repeat protein (TIGR03987 family)